MISRTLIVVTFASAIGIPFIKETLNENETIKAESAAAATFSEIRARPSIKEEIPILKSNVQVVDTYITGVPEMDNYPRGKDLVYTK